MEGMMATVVTATLEGSSDIDFADPELVEHRTSTFVVVDVTAVVVVATDASLVPVVYVVVLIVAAKKQRVD
jgi:hypothetical protein